MPEYCYSGTTLGAFTAATGASIALNDPVRAAKQIAQRYRAEWRDWKCGVTVEAIRNIRAAVDKVRPHAQVSINTLPFFRGDFDNAVEEVFGQDVMRLRDVVDVFEVMAYHQILAKGAEWPAAIASDIRARSRKAAVCTLQTRPLYLEGMHARRGRSETLDADEFCRTVDAVERSDVDGVCIFTFADLLDLGGSSAGNRMIERLRRFRR